MAIDSDSRVEMGWRGDLRLYLNHQSTEYLLTLVFPLPPSSLLSFIHTRTHVRTHSHTHTD